MTGILHTADVAAYVL